MSLASKAALFALAMSLSACERKSSPPPSPLCDVKAPLFGAKGDGKTLDTQAIQSAIDACAGTGGSVYLHDGTFLTAMIHLGSNMTFYIDSSATLLGVRGTGASVDPSYPDTNPETVNSTLSSCKKALVYAEAAHDLVLEGGGVIDGNSDPSYAPWGSATLANGQKAHPESTRPIPLFLTLSDRVVVRNLTIRHGAMWDFVPLETDDLTVSNLTVDSTDHDNRDGIDIVDCHHVRMDHLNINSDDDGICLKSGSARGVDDVQIVDSVVASVRDNGIKFGTSSVGPFTNTTFRNIEIRHAFQAAIAIDAVDGAQVSNITYESITFADVGSPFFIILGQRTPPVGSVDTVTFKDITGKNITETWGSPISGTTIAGTTYTVKNLLFDNVDIVVRGGDALVPPDPAEYDGRYPEVSMWGDMPAFGYFLRHVDGATFRNCKTSAAGADQRKWLETRDVSNVAIE
jgi:polygalacturonase